MTTNGYLYKMVNGRRVFQHREIMENSLGRKLGRHEQVHHKNGIRNDNRIENLQVVTKTAHESLHKAYKEAKQVKDKRKRKYAFRKCPVCGQPFARLKKQLKKNSTCSRSCALTLRSRSAIIRDPKNLGK